MLNDSFSPHPSIGTSQYSVRGNHLMEQVGLVQKHTGFTVHRDLYNGGYTLQPAYMSAASIQRDISSPPPMPLAHGIIPPERL